MTELPQHIAVQTNLAQIEYILHQAGYHITGTDSQRPWGGFICIDSAQAEQFAADLKTDERASLIRIVRDAVERFEGAARRD